jgi:hypothetical protein
MVKGVFFDSKTLVVYSLLPQLLVAGIALLCCRRRLGAKRLLSMLGMAVLGSVL